MEVKFEIILFEHHGTFISEDIVVQLAFNFTFFGLQRRPIILKTFNFVVKTPTQPQLNLT